MTGSVDGLISGMNTSQVIAQLMQLEAAPQAALQNKVKSEQTVKSALQGINTRLATLKTAAETLTKADTWKGVRATSSSSAVAVSATPGASTGALTFNVVNLASAHVVTAAVPASGSITDGSPFEITFNDGRVVPITLGTDTSAQGVADSINAAKTDVRAAVITTANGPVLQLTATKTGQQAGFTVSSGLQSTITQKIAAAGADATIAVGDQAAGGYTVTSPNNVFTGLMSGITLTATKVENGVTVTVNPDKQGLADKMQAMVDAANSLLNEIKLQTAYDATKKIAGTLLGNFQVSEIRSGVLSQVSAPVDGLPDGFKSYKALGVELDKFGNLTFNRDTFLAAYDANPTDTQTAVTTGLAKQLVDRTSTDNTSLTATITNHDDYIRDLNKQIDGWDDRLALRQEALKRQFSNLEVALGKMRSQSTWLAGQLAGLPTGGGS
ncbi:flagellar filament capping protein FliD [Planosporangium sp. 12N6]|uniref:flagellar filament capping protein FliD n=1 Tax=Planosporangium spinosum TaxID=3402278 RepID=UPI003CFAB2CF